MSESELIHWKSLVNPHYIGAYSLLPKEEKTVTIINVVREQVKGEGGKSEECTVAYLVNEKPFILNRTNCKTLTKILKSPYIQHWAGKTITIFAAKIKAFGEEMEALRIKDTLPKEKALPELTPDHKQWQEAVKFLSSDTGTIEQIKKKYFLTEENQELLISEAI